MCFKVVGRLAIVASLVTSGRGCLKKNLSEAGCDEFSISVLEVLS